MIKFMQREIPSFKLFDAVLHMDETSPHMHIIGTPIIKYHAKKGPDVVISKSKVFHRDTMKEIHVKLREFNKAMAAKISELANKLGYVASKKNEIKKVTKAKWNDRRVEFVSVMETTGRSKGIKERAVYDTLELVNHNKLSRSERKALMSSLGAIGGQVLKEAEGLESYLAKQRELLREGKT